MLFFSGWWNTWRTAVGKRDVAEVFFSVVPLFPSTRGSSDSIAPRNKFANWESGDERFPSSIFRSPSMQQVSQVSELNHRWSESSRLSTQAWTDWSAGPWIKDRRAFCPVPKVKVLNEKKKPQKKKPHSNFSCFRVSTQIPTIHSFVHSSMAIPYFMDTKGSENKW